MLLDPRVTQESAVQWESLLGIVSRTHKLGCDLVDAGHALVNDGSAEKRVALFFLARATLALNSVEVLFAAGLALDATSVLRTLVELAIDFNFMWKEDTAGRVKLYAEYVHVLNHRRLQKQELHFGPTDPAKEEAAFAELAPHAPAGVSSGAEMRAHVEAEYERVKDNYPNANSWHRKDTFRRAADTQLERFYDLIHRRGSDASHASPTSMASLYKIKDGKMKVGCRSVVPEEPFALALAGMLYQTLAIGVCEVLELKRADELQALQTETNQALDTYFATKL